MLNINLLKMEDSIGVMSNLQETQKAEDVSFVFSAEAKKKLDNILTTGTVTANNQILHLKELIFSKKDEEFLTAGQSPFITSGNTVLLTGQSRSLPHFKVILNALAPHKIAAEQMYLVEITLQNFSIDISESRRTVYDDLIGYENVQMTVYSGQHMIRIIKG